MERGDEAAAVTRTGMASPGAVCVVGLPGSGAGMVTRLLQSRGLWLGEPETLVPPTSDDPDSGFESRLLVDVNEQLGRFLGAHEASATQALATIAGTAAGRPWGWRHPGDQTTLPFWCGLVTPLKAVVCVRNQAGAETIPMIGPHGASRGAYEELLRTLLPPWQILVTHYESWFTTPYREIERIAEFVELPAAHEGLVATPTMFGMFPSTETKARRPRSLRTRAAEEKRSERPLRLFAPEDREPHQEPRKLQFLMLGSPNDAFYSQAAMFRLALDSHGGIYEAAKLSMVLGADEPGELPDAWQGPCAGIDIHWAAGCPFPETGYASDFGMDAIDESADVCFICDADTVVVKPFSAEFLGEIVESRAVGGVITHYPPPRTDARGRDLSAFSDEEFWEAISGHALGRAIPLPYAHTLTDQPQRCPFYVNRGFVAASPAVFKQMQSTLGAIDTKVREVLDNYFRTQISFAMAIEQHGIPTIALPMRYNFPNDPIADARYPQDLDEVHVLHYLRTNHFDRHRIFSSRDHFEAFLALELSGSNAVFQRAIRRLTAGTYPFDLLPTAAQSRERHPSGQRMAA